MVEAVSPRACGACTACCYTHSVPAVDKGMGEHCSWCTEGKGCVSYGTRPLACRVYRCWWLQGRVPEQLRPDVLGIVIDDWLIPNESFTLVNLWEAVPDRLSTDVAEVLINALLGNGKRVVQCLSLDRRRYEIHFPDVMSGNDRKRFMAAVHRLLETDGASAREF